MFKKPLCCLLFFLFLASVCVSGVFAASESEPRYVFSESTFVDIAPDDDCYRFVRNVYENGLMNGKGHGVFDPGKNVTAAELVTVAARLHALLFDSDYAFEKTDVWYDTYRTYCKEKGVFIPAYEDYASFVTVRELAAVLCSVVTEEMFEDKIYVRINDGFDDVYVQDILKLCRSGVLDFYYTDFYHRFEEVKREYLAKVLSRIVAPHKRQTYDISNCSEIETGDYIIFGSYEQDNDMVNGAEPIEWIVLERNGNDLLVLSRYGLDCVPYNDSETDVTWETCSLRKWLNDQFINTAFSSTEKSMILERNVIAEGNSIHFPTYDHIDEELIEPGNDTLDKIFIPSWSQISTNSIFAKKEIDNMIGYPGPHTVSLACVPSEYAIARGAYTINSVVERAEEEWGVYVEPGSPTCIWWIRNPGKSNSMAEIIKYEGGCLDYYGIPVNSGHEAVRPAMWVTILDRGQN